MTLDAVKPACIGPRCDVAALFEKLERLTMTLAAQLESRGRIRSSDEATCVSFSLFGLRRIAAVAAAATDARSAVCAGFKNRHDLARRIRLSAMACSAIVLVLGNDRPGFVKESGSGE